MKKVLLATQMIEKRIAHADHVTTGIPGERQLAEELGLSRGTVRLAVQKLVESGVLVRQSNGRLDVGIPASGEHKPTIGFLVPAFYMDHFIPWRQGLEVSLQEYEATIRTVSYGHWADPVIKEMLDGCDGLYFIPSDEQMPPWLAARMKDSQCRVVVLNRDETANGLRSMTLSSNAKEIKLFEHLYSLGHREIDCINTQLEDSVIRERITMWQQFKELRGLEGRFHSLEVDQPAESAYQLVQESLRKGRLTATALFCTTCPAAIGAMRALHEAGLKAGRDISVCAINGEGIGHHLVPSLTALEPPSQGVYLHRSTEWMLGEAEWAGPMLIEPGEVPLFEGESTGPVPTPKSGETSHAPLTKTRKLTASRQKTLTGS